MSIKALDMQERGGLFHPDSQVELSKLMLLCFWSILMYHEI